MKLKIKAQNPLEFIGLKANYVPFPLAHTHMSSFLSRATYDAVELGVFEAIGHEALTVEEIAGKCGLNPRALKSLMGLLTSLDYFNYKNERFSLKSKAKKWILKESPNSLVDQILFMRSIWSWLDEIGPFLKTGKGLEFHKTFDERQWELYQRGMECIAKISIAEVTERTPLPANPVKMLDIGGSHGLYSVELCKKHPGLQSTILDLPEAVEKAGKLLEKHNMGERVRYKPGNALTDSMGNEEYDLVFISSLMHHFSPEQNRELTEKAAKALKPGGFFVVQEFSRPEPSESADIAGAILDLFFSLSSNSGGWSLEEMKLWQREAGLNFHKVNRLLTMPGYLQVIAVK